MILQNIEFFSTARQFSQADLARRSGLSRQLISVWLNASSKRLNPTTDSLLKLAQGLGVRIQDLVDPIPLLGNPQERQALETSLLWDRLFPSVEHFLGALLRNDLRAIARLVEVYGMFAAAKIVGLVVWNKFQRYARYLPPLRRKQCEALWNYRASQV